MRKTASSTRLILRLGVLSVCVMPASLGCSSYQLGTRTLYRPDVQTVHVPVFESDSFRRGLGERLTEAVIKEIQRKTPYAVADSGNADSILTGRIVRDQKRSIAENANDEPRDIELGFVVQAQWQDRFGNPLSQLSSKPMSPSMINVGQEVHFVPESGQSVAWAQQDAINRLAEQIVAQMEVPW